MQYYDFEKPVEELERKIADLQTYSDAKKPATKAEIERLEGKLLKVMREVYGNLTPWQRTLISRHLQRPYAEDYIGLIFTDFLELHGDRAFMDDMSILGGVAWFRGEPVMLIGHQKGRTTQEKIKRNFGMPHPEGYRKALRLMKLAEKFSRPTITLVDTPGAYPGIEAEERGQAGAIARNLKEMASLKSPILSVIIGEGGSGGALALALGDRLLMMEHSIYSVISPEGCAAILWKDSSKSNLAAEALKLTAEDGLRLGVVDEVIKEPLGGAHRDYQEAAISLAEAINRHLQELLQLSTDELLRLRYSKLRNIGKFEAAPPVF